MEQKNKLFVGNLSFSVDDAKLGEMFAEFGEVTEAKVITDKFSGRSKGFGFVTFANDDDAAKAAEDMNGKDADGRPLTVNVAKPMQPREPRN
jgi:RNA recognition motif-containing protein